MHYTIRALEQAEAHLLRDFAYEAVFQRDPDNPIGRDVLEEPEIRVFYEDFGKADDMCFVAEMDGTLVGAVWTRILSGDVRGFGNMDPYTPEFAISVYKAYRSEEIGTALMRHMLDALRTRGYEKTSLAVQKDNYALYMYQKVGFSIIKETDEEYLMLCILDDSVQKIRDREKT